MDDIFEAEQEKSVPVKEPFDIERCSPTPPDRVGREFVLKYYTIMNRSPENLHCFYTDTASFTHDDIDPMQRRTVTANCKKEINEVMLERIKTYQHTKTKVSTVDSIDTLGDGVMVQVNGEISFNEQPMRPFSQTIILFRKTPFHYYVQNDIFRFCDFVEELEPEKCDNIAEMPPKDMPEDWGSQCEEFESEPRAESTQRETRRGNRRNEVKLDTSDSGLSSDTEKVIMDIQSINLKNILQEPRQITKESVMKRGPTPTGSSEIEAPAGETETGDNDISDNHTQSFRDSCILMINNVVNPNIEFDEAKRDEALASETEKAKENAESANTSKSDESGSSKNRYKKRKEKRKSKGDISRDISREKSLDKAHNEPDIEVQSNDSIDERTLTAEESVSPEESIEKNEETPGVSEPKREEMPKPLESKHEETPKQSKPIEREPPVTTEKISYAELARAGKDEWVDELATRRESLSNKGKHRNPRRNSRGEKTTPSHASSQSSAGSSHGMTQFFLTFFNFHVFERFLHMKSNKIVCFNFIFNEYRI